MSIRVYLWVVSISMAFVLSVSTAHADTTSQSSIVQLQILTPSHDKHDMYHGVLWLNIDKSKHNYRWGGANCGNKTLEPSFVKLLVDAFVAKHNVALHYKLRPHGDRTYRCITGLTIARK